MLIVANGLVNASMQSVYQDRTVKLEFEHHRAMFPAPTRKEDPCDQIQAHLWIEQDFPAFY